MTFRVEQIDHVELIVSDRHAAAAWYRDVLGLEVVSQYRQWAEDPRGPLMIATPKGDTKLALFQGQPLGSRESVGFHLVAFRVDADGFLEFLSELPALNLKDSRGRSVTKELVADHENAFSIYFNDPWGNFLEITTYEHTQIRQRLAEWQAKPPPV